MSYICYKHHRTQSAVSTVTISAYAYTYDSAYANACASTAVRPQLDRPSTVDDLRYARRPTRVWAAAVWPK